jgi:hypothetical protein
MLDAYRDLVDELLNTPAVVRSALGDRGENAIPSGVRTIIAEWSDRDREVLSRVQIMTRQELAYFGPRRRGEPVGDEPLTVLLEQMETARGELVSTLINLSLKEWTRQAIDETEGETTLADEIERHVEFDEAQRRRLQEALT